MGHKSPIQLRLGGSLSLLGFADTPMEYKSRNWESRKQKYISVFSFQRFSFLFAGLPLLANAPG
jgi:hypothetical protein